MRRFWPPGSLFTQEEVDTIDAALLHWLGRADDPSVRDMQRMKLDARIVLFALRRAGFLPPPPEEREQ
jgi:hypothetical protein